MSLNPMNRQDGNNKEEPLCWLIGYKIISVTFCYQVLPENTPFLHQDYFNITSVHPQKGIYAIAQPMDTIGGGAGIWTPDTADMSLNPENRQDGNNK